MAEQAAHNRLVEGSNPSGPIFCLTSFITFYPLSNLHFVRFLLSATHVCYFHQHSRSKLRVYTFIFHLTNSLEIFCTFIHGVDVEKISFCVRMGFENLSSS